MLSYKYSKTWSLGAKEDKQQLFTKTNTAPRVTGKPQACLPRQRGSSPPLSAPENTRPVTAQRPTPHMSCGMGLRCEAGRQLKACCAGLGSHLRAGGRTGAEPRDPSGKWSLVPEYLLAAVAIIQRKH